MHFWRSALGLLALLAAVSAKSHFDLQLHLKTVSRDSLLVDDVVSHHGFLENSLISKLKEVLKTSDLEVNLYDFRITGENLNVPTVMLHARLTFNEDVTREQVVKLLDEMSEEDKETLMIPYITQTESAVVPNNFAQKLYALDAPLTECENGGVLLPNNTCVCPTYFTGRNCSFQICAHEGIASLSGECYCPPGYVGKHCETLPVLPCSSSQFDFSQRSLVVVLDIGTTMAFGLEQLYSAVADLKKNEEAKKFYKDYVLLTYALYRGSFVEVIQRSDTLEGLLKQIAAVHPVNNDEKQPTLTAVVKALLHEGSILPRSTVIVLTNSLASDGLTFNDNEEHANAENLLLKTTLHWQHNIHVILTDKGNKKYDTDPGQSLEALKRSAHRTNGEFLYIGNKKASISTVFGIVINSQLGTSTTDVGREINEASKVITISNPTSKVTQLLVYGDVKLTTGNIALTPDASGPGINMYKIAMGRKEITFTRNGNGVWGYRSVLNSGVIDAFAAFTNEIESEATSNYAVAGIPHQVVLRAINAPADSTILTTLVGADGVILPQGGFNKRLVDSNFPYVAKAPVNCKPGPFYIKVEVQRFNSNAFTALIPSYCFQPVHRVPNTYPDCGNGYYNSVQKKCICRPYYKGDNCEITECLNLGKVNLFPGNGQPICFCEPGFKGTHCETMACSKKDPVPGSPSRTFSVVLQRSYSQTYLNDDIKNGIQKALDKVDGHFDNFVLTTFVNSRADETLTIKTKATNDSALFLDLLLSKNIEYSMAVPGDQGALSAIKQLLEQKVDSPNNELVLVFLDSVSSKDQKLATELKTTALNKFTEIHIIATQAYGPDGDGECLSAADTAFYQSITYTTGGHFIDHCSTKNTEEGLVGKFLETYITTAHRLEPVRRVSSEKCADASVSLTIGDGTTERIIFVEGAATDVNVKAADGSAGHKIEKISTLGQLYLYKLSNLAQTKYDVTFGSVQTRCYVKVLQESDFELFLRYSTNPGDDAPIATATFGSTLHPVVFVSSQLQADLSVRITVPHGNGYDETGVLRQTGCTYDYYFDRAFSCSEYGNSYQAIVTISTTDKVTVERSLLAYCQPPAIPCLNDGKAKADGTCECGNQFTGNYCETPVCLNGGTAYETICECTVGFQGKFCEQTLCSSWNFMATHDVQNFEFKTVSFVVQTLQKEVNEKLASNIETFVNGLVSANQFKHLSLITFDDQQASTVINTVNSKRFVDTFKATLTAKYDDYKGRVVRALDGVKLAAQTSIYKPAVVYLFASKDTALANAVDTLELLAEGGVQVNVIIVDDGDISGYNNLVYYHYVSYASGGRFLHLKQANVEGLLNNYLAKTVFENGLIEDKLWQTCTDVKTIEFPVEGRNKWFTIIARGVGAKDSLEVFDAQTNAKVDLTKYKSVKDDGTFVVVLDNVTAGQKKINVKSTSGGCSVQIRTSSELHTDFGFTKDQHDDFPTERPAFLSGTKHSTMITLKIGSSLYDNQKVVPSQLTLLSRNTKTGVDNVLSETSIKLRDTERCAHQFITPTIDVPEGSYDLARSPFLIRLAGQDESGKKFQRVQIYFPEQLQCANGATQDEFGYCKCTVDYSGDDCTVPKCKNGGIADLSVCSCRSGFYGKLCEKYV